MKYFISGLWILFSMVAVAQTTLNDLSDEFDDTASIKKWKFLHEEEKLPNKIKRIQVNTDKKGLLQLQPAASGWYGDYQAPFMFKMVTGNFDVRMKMKITGVNDSLPFSDWSLAGLMVRQPKRTTQENWVPRQENWLFITTGIAHQPGLPVLEVKTTNNSLSNLKLRPAKTGWVELRIVRIDAAFILMCRYGTEAWQIIERFYRPLMRGPLQVGINAYSSWEGIPEELKNDPARFNSTIAGTAADLVTEVDYIRFATARPDWKAMPAAFNKQYSQTLYYSEANLLTDYAVSNEALLKILGP